MIDRATDMPVGAASAEELKEMAAAYAAAARERLSEGGERVKDYVVKQPVRAMGIALGLGVLVGWMIKRR